MRGPIADSGEHGKGPRRLAQPNKTHFQCKADGNKNIKNTKTSKSKKQ